MIDEIADTIARVRDLLDGLAVRGLRAADPDQVALLRSTGEELSRIGAGHMAERIETLLDAIEADQGEAAQALLRARTSVGLFDRLLTLEVAEAHLSLLVRED